MKLTNNKVKGEDPVKMAMTKEFRNMSSEMPLSELSRVFERHNFVFVDEAHIVSINDLLVFI